jgi:hypothetical protein
MITVVSGTNQFQKGDFSKHKDFNPSIHKVYNTVEEWKQSEDYPKANRIIPFSDNEIKAIRNPNSYCNNDYYWK